MKRFIIPAMLGFAAFACGCATASKKEAAVRIEADMGISDMVIQKSKEHSVSRIAVFDFPSIDGDISAEGKLIAERVINKLVNEGSLNVIERTRIEKIIAEQQLQASGIVDSATAKEIGKVAGVEAAVIGTITRLGDESEVNARMINVQTAEILGAYSGSTKIIAGPGDPQLLANDVKIEREAFEAMKAGKPKEYREKLSAAKKITNLRKEDPMLFEKLMNTRNRLYFVYRQEPNRFVKMMGTTQIPIGANMMEVQKALEMMRVYLPEDYRKLYELRQQLVEVKKEKKTDSTISKDKYYNYRGKINYKENPRYEKYQRPEDDPGKKGSKISR